MTSMLSDPQPNWATPMMLCVVSPFCGVVLGGLTNAINGRISADYYAIVMSWDWADAPTFAIWQGMFEGAALGAFFGIFFAVASAASTRLRCPPRLALATLGLALAIVLTSWVIGGIIGVILAHTDPSLWGFVFVGVPPRVNLPRFAWVGGTILGAYIGTLLALLIASIWLHRRWKRMAAPVHAFPVLPTIPQSKNRP